MSDVKILSEVINELYNSPLIDSESREFNVFGGLKKWRESHGKR